MNDVEIAQAHERLKRLATESRATGDPKSWFDELYRSAEGQTEAVPWAHLTVNPLLVEWLEQQQITGNGKSALIVGCGLGDDAEAMSRLGFAVTAFDISPEAIAWCRRRFPDSQVRYTVADALALPEAWSGQFDLIVEIYTLQSLPDHTLREQVATNLARCLDANGSLLVICGGRDASDEPGTMPWPLTRDELAMFKRLGLREMTFEDLPGKELPFFRHFRAYYRA